MKKYTSLLSLLPLALAVACSSTEKKVEQPAPVVQQPPKVEEAPVVKAAPLDPQVKIDAYNETLSKVPMLALPPFQSSFSGAKFESSAKPALTATQEIVKDLPDGYVLEVKGHHNPAPDKAQRTSNKLSVARAKAVYDYFVKSGVPADKLSYRGVGSSEHDAKLSNDENRRVTFQVVKAAAKAE